MDEVTKLEKEYQQQLEKLRIEIQKKEQAKIDGVKKEIENITEKHGYFCGAILTPDDILGIVKLALTARENIRIPFQLYKEVNQRKVNGGKVRNIKKGKQ